MALEGLGSLNLCVDQDEAAPAMDKGISVDG